VVDRHATALLWRNVPVSHCALISHPFYEMLTIASRYVAMHAMQEDTPSGPEHNHAESHTASPRKQTRPQMRDTLATVVGMVLPLLTQFGHHH
jgi:hypothetical protein